MALISVPAWPIPIQNTKLTIGNAQATGIMLPHTPMPVHAAQVMLPRNIVSMLSAIAKAMYQARGGLGASMMRVTLSVIFANVLSPLGGDWKALSSVAAAMVRQAPCSGS